MSSLGFRGDTRGRNGRQDHPIRRSSCHALCIRRPNFTVVMWFLLQNNKPTQPSYVRREWAPLIAPHSQFLTLSALGVTPASRSSLGVVKQRTSCWSAYRGFWTLFRCSAAHCNTVGPAKLPTAAELPLDYSIRRNFSVVWALRHAIVGSECLPVKMMMMMMMMMIIFINCNWIATRWQWLFYMHTNMN